MLNVTRMGVLRAVARHGSFSGAAETLGYTQPAVSRQIATLEAETGAILVTRGAGGARLTEAGEVLVRHAESIFAALDEAENELRAVLGVEAGRLRLATFSSAAASIVPLAIARFRALHPGVELVVEMMEPEESIPRLRCGELDIALSNDGESHRASRSSASTCSTIRCTWRCRAIITSRRARSCASATSPMSRGCSPRRRTVPTLECSSEPVTARDSSR